AAGFATARATSWRWVRSASADRRSVHPRSDRCCNSWPCPDRSQGPGCPCPCDRRATGPPAGARRRTAAGMGAHRGRREWAESSRFLPNGDEVCGGNRSHPIRRRGREESSPAGEKMYFDRLDLGFAASRLAFRARSTPEEVATSPETERARNGKPDANLPLNR